jgi:hypothetical protein
MTEVATTMQTSDPGAKVPGRRRSFVESMQGLPRRPYPKDDDRPQVHPDDSETTASVESWRSTLLGKSGTTRDRQIGAAT